jgi:Uncharacterised protein family UPF0047
MYVILSAPQSLTNILSRGVCGTIEYNIEHCRCRMAIVTESVQIRSRGENDMIDITRPTSKAIEDSKLKQGMVTIFVAGSTAVATTIEYEPGLRVDFPKCYPELHQKI